MSFPQSFIHQIQELLADDAGAFFAALQGEPPVSIRLNPQKTSSPTMLDKNGLLDKHNIQENVDWSRYGYYLSQRPVFTLDPMLHAGVYYVQEAASMFIEQAVEQLQGGKENLNILDLCAAPGGKSTHLLSLFPESCLLVSNEVIRGRANILYENISKWGYSNTVVTNSPTKEFSRLPNFFDVMLVDAPCSGEGMFRKDRDAISEWSENNVALCAERQRKILADVWSSLKEGGVLIYSTCTYNRKENEENIQWLVRELGAESLQFRLQASWGIVESNENNVYGYRFYPHRTKSEGFFMAVVRKIGASAGTVNRKLKATTPPKGISEYRKLIKSDKDWQLVQQANELRAIPVGKAMDVAIVEQLLNVISSGLGLGELKGKDFIPSAALALSTDLNITHYPSIKLNLETALHFLRRDSISVDAAERGFVLVCYNDVPLGWIKNLGNRSNNLYPSEWRIRMELK